MKVILLFALLLPFQFLSAGIDEASTDVVVLPDGSIVLADFYLDQEGEQPAGRPKQIDLNPRILLQVKLYTEFLKEQVKPILYYDKEPISENLEELGKRESEVSYFLVKDYSELKKYCAPGMGKTFKVESGKPVQEIACGSGEEIYLNEESFGKLGLLDQALVLMHERLATRRFPDGGRSLNNISSLIAGLKTYLNIAYDQQKGLFRKQSAAEQDLLQKFFNSYVYLSGRFGGITISGWSIHSFGGGIVFDKTVISEDALVDIHSVIKGASKISKGVSIINSSLESVDLSENVSISSSTISIIHPFPDEVTAVRVGVNAKILNSTIKAISLELGASVTVKDSMMNAVSLIAKDHVLISKSVLDFSSNPDGRYYGYKADIVTINAQESLVNGNMTYESNTYYAPLGYQIVYPAILLQDGYGYVANCGLSAQTEFENEGPKDGFNFKINVNLNYISGCGYYPTSYKLTLTFNPMNKPLSNSFMLYEGKVYPVGEYRFRYLTHFASNALYPAYQDLKLKLDSLGIEFINNDPTRLLLPIKGEL